METKTLLYATVLIAIGLSIYAVTLKQNITLLEMKLKQIENNE